MPLYAPFPYFGGKRKIARQVWERFGDVPNYVEPFAGSLAVLLQRPHAPKTETVNDHNAFLCNFWRAVIADPEAVAHEADRPCSELDLHAIHRWCHQQTDTIERLREDIDFYDVRMAGRWVWGACNWIGSGWCMDSGNAGRGLSRKLPHVGNAGQGLSRQLPHVGNAGRGLSRKLPHVGDAGRSDFIMDWLAALSSRLRGVRICCGDWSRVVTPAVTTQHGLTAVFLDPPYALADADDSMYLHDADVSHAVRAWCITNGDNPQFRIALCGYEGEPPIPGWDVLRWKARKGYAQGDNAGNSARETIWFSPHCQPAIATQLTLWSATS